MSLFCFIKWYYLQTSFHLIGRDIVINPPQNIPALPVLLSLAKNRGKPQSQRRVAQTKTASAMPLTHSTSR